MEQRFSNDIDGPKTIIMGGVHGNEKLGIQVLTWLKDYLRGVDIIGEIWLIIGNPVAYEKDLRFIDTDLNRIMSQEHLNAIAAKPENQRSFEEKRALELAPYFDGVHFLLDIHATIKPTPDAFTYSANSPLHHALASLFDVGYMISEVDPDVTSAPEGPADFYADTLGGIGLTLEAGWIGDSDLLDSTKAGVIRYLNATGNIKSARPKDAVRTPELLLVYQELKTTSKNFKFDKRKIRNFDFFKAGECVAYQDGNEIIAERDSYVIFPVLTTGPDQIAGLLAYKA